MLLNDIDYDDDVDRIAVVGIQNQIKYINHVLLEVQDQKHSSTSKRFCLLGCGSIFGTSFVSAVAYDTK